jgi:hypothetical protein
MTKELPAGYEQVVNVLADVQARIAELKAREEELKNMLRQQLGQGDWKGLSVKQSTRFDAALGAQFLTPEQVEACMVTQLDPKLVKEKLTTEEIRQASKPEATLRVTVKAE